MCTLCVTKELFYEKDDHFLAVIIDLKKRWTYSCINYLCLVIVYYDKHNEQKVVLIKCTFYTLIKIFEFYQWKIQ